MPSSLYSHSDLPPVELAHDGSVTGCLCAVAEAYKRSAQQPVRFVRPDADMQLKLLPSPRSVREDARPPLRNQAASTKLAGERPREPVHVKEVLHELPLFTAARIAVDSDPARAERFLNYIATKASGDVVHTFLRALTAMPEGLEPHLLAYARKAVLHGACIVQAHADPDVIFVHRHARKVSLEIHRFKGLLRFQEFRSGRFVALYEPDYDITLPLAFHFRRRLASQRWIILDCRRQQAVTWDGKRLNAEHPEGELLTGALLERCLADDEPSEAEARSRALWQTFHRTVAIETRTNPALQRQFMPARYWKHLTEMKG